MSEASTPKTWWEAWSSHVVWGALVFTCFLVFVEKLVEQHFGQALAAFLLGLGIMAVALHSKTWLEKTNPNWAFAAALALVIALVLSPFVEQKHWPFSAWFPSPAASQSLTADEIADAVIKKLPKNPPTPSPIMLAEAGMKQPPNPQTELVGGPYVPSDIERMIPLFIDLNDALSKAAPVFGSQQEIVQNWQNQFRQMGAATYTQKLRTIADQMIDARSFVYKIVEDHNAYRNEMSAAVSDRLAAVDIAASAIGFLIDNIDALSGVPEAQQFRILNKDVQRVQTTALGYNNWVQESIQHVQTKLRRLRDYKQ